MSTLLDYRDSIEKAVRIGIARPTADEQLTIETALHERVNWRCSDCAIRAYKKANNLLQRQIEELAKKVKKKMKE